MRETATKFFESKGIEVDVAVQDAQTLLGRNRGSEYNSGSWRSVDSLERSDDLMGKAINEPTANEVYMVEVVGHDGLVHHVGPFQTRADAQSWMAQNTQQPAGSKSARADAALPKLSIV